ncbi:MAG: prepilin-type N-terminal cleavage/methylation domain-containing protein [Candidatus Peribacteria bacterium]|jgi:prepilin-type N-terminal cleavage/methylation domain-containing protein|nr:prepilin-type N-terminal cleavage/methylation domain-containing protein [Candidatus Peribacteria bacterium]
MEELKSQLKTRKNNKAFTLAELVVVIVILAIITSISFISISNYAAATRDIKRLNDITELYKKIILEKEKESDLEGLVINPETRQVMIG